MSVLVDCGACQAGDHARHDSSHHGPPGVLGGHQCGCQGNCRPRPLPFDLGALTASGAPGTRPVEPAAPGRGQTTARPEGEAGRAADTREAGREGGRPPRVSPDWRDDAACLGTDPEAYFPHGAGERPSPAVRATCRDCPVREPCLETALAVRDTDDHGYWGGMTRMQRRRERVRRDVVRLARAVADETRAAG
jgi:WhiB family transcriptional regulator, redox-sensing transcriptional regulator